MADCLFNQEPVKGQDFCPVSDMWLFKFEILYLRISVVSVDCCKVKCSRENDFQNWLLPCK